MLPLESVRTVVLYTRCYVYGSGQSEKMSIRRKKHACSHSAFFRFPRRRRGEKNTIMFLLASPPSNQTNVRPLFFLSPSLLRPPFFPGVTPNISQQERERERMEVGGERPFSSYVGSPRVEQRRRSEPEKVSPPPPPPSYFPGIVFLPA